MVLKGFGILLFVMVFTYHKSPCHWHNHFRYLELDLIHPENYKPGANMYTSSLWHFGSTELPEYFTIHNSDERRNLNFVTFSNEPASNGQLMQIGTKDLHFYQPKGQFRNDALWNFRPANFTIQARVCKFEFELPSKDDLESLAIPIQVSDEVAIVNDTEKPFVVVDEAVKLNESVVVCFLQSFKMFDEENVSVECDILSQIAEVCGNSTPQVSTKFDKTTNTQWSAAKEREFPINQRVPLDPKSIANVTCFCNWIFNVEIPFSAIVEVRAASDVALCPTPVELQCIHTEMQDERIVEYLLKYEKFTGKVVPKNKNVPQGAIHCRVMGRVKVSCGLNAKLKVKYCS